jgi:hypothetical protein
VFLTTRQQVVKGRDLTDWFDHHFGTTRLSKSTDVFHPLYKPIECLGSSTMVHGCLPVLLSKLAERMQVGAYF